jgi:hypothetical protein
MRLCEACRHKARLSMWALAVVYNTKKKEGSANLNASFNLSAFEKHTYFQCFAPLSSNYYSGLLRPSFTKWLVFLLTVVITVGSVLCFRIETSRTTSRSSMIILFVPPSLCPTRYIQSHNHRAFIAQRVDRSDIRYSLCLFARFPDLTPPSWHT